ncbi:MAG: hypothetical protein ABIG42_08085, partial [bacterium]
IQEKAAWRCDLKSLYSVLVILVMMMAIGLSACSSSSVVSPGDMPSDNAALTNGEWSENWVGLYQVAIHPDLSYDLTPLRGSSAVGDFFFDIDLGIFLRGPFCPVGDCFNITAIGTTGDIPPRITFNVSVKHPFAQYNSGLPLSGTNRADLDVFDPKVVILTEGDINNPLAGTVVDSGLSVDGTNNVFGNFTFVEDNDPVNDPLFYGQPTDARLTDIAGQPVDPVTNNTEIFIFTKPTDYPTADVHPYKAIFNGAVADGGTNNPVANDNRMSQGESADTAHFELNVTAGSPTVSFIIGLSAAYGQSAVGKDNRAPESVKYFVPAFRTPTATDIQVTVTDGTIGSVDATIQLDIVDPQAGATLDPTWLDYESQADGGTHIPPTNRNGSVTFTDMNIAEVQISVPGLTTPFFATYNQTQGIGNGEPSNPWIFNDTIPQAGEIAGTYAGYVLVRDDVYDNDSGGADFETQAFVVKKFKVTFN